MTINNPFLRRLWHIVKNKYVAATILFVLLITLTDNNLFVTMRLRGELSEVREEKERLINEMRHDSTHLEVLRGDAEAMERYGREVYYLRATDEDVYVFEK